MMPTRHPLRRAVATAALCALAALWPAGAQPAASPADPSRTFPPATQPSDYGELVRHGPDGRPVWDRPRFDQRAADRERMVAEQIASHDRSREAVRDRRVLDAMRAVPRHEFVPDTRQRSAYADTPLPIGFGQTISQPYIVALMTELLEVSPGDRILEIGTGSGYQAAVLSELTPYVFTIEIVEPLAASAAERFERLGYRTIRCRTGDGYFGWPEAAPFDGIIVTCAAGHVPPPLWEQLKPGGRMVIPIGGEFEVQRLLVLTKRPDGSRASRSVIPVRFVPMTGRIREP